MTDDGGVLGNLPDARPGRRSPKREAGAGRPAKAAEEAARKAEKSGKAAARPASAGDRPSPPPPPPPEPSSDPVGAVVRTAANVTLTGLRITGALTQELLRRLPRP